MIAAWNSLSYSPSPSSLLPAQKKKFRLNFSPRAWAGDPGCQSFSAICRLLIISVQTLLLTSASVFLLQGEFSNPCWKCFSTGTAQAWNWLESLSPVHSAPLLPRVPESWRKRNLQGNSKMLCMSGSYRLTWSLDVHSWIMSLSILWSSVNFDGIFPQFQKLEKLVFRPLLQSHQGSCLLL